MRMTIEQRVGDGPQYFIYGLYDPLYCEIRYVGQTRQGQYRPAQHCHARMLKKNWPIHSWIKSVLAEGRKISWDILEVTGPDQLDEAEMKWIRDLRAAGHRLTNLAIGGRTSHGCIPWNKGKSGCYGPKTIEMMRQRKLGKRWTKEHKNQFKTAVKLGKHKGCNRMGDNLARPVICVTDGKKFSSMIAAARHYRYPVHIVRRSVKSRLGPKSKAKYIHKFVLANPESLANNAFYLGKVKPGHTGSMMSTKQTP